jgi:hypothetical protein
MHYKKISATKLGAFLKTTQTYTPGKLTKGICLAVSDKKQDQDKQINHQKGYTVLPRNSSFTNSGNTA